MRRFLVALLALIAIAAAIGIVFRRPLALFLAERVIARNMGASLLDEVPDGLHVALCGAGSPLPDPDRSGPCVAVIAGRRLYVIDSGSGSSRSLARMRLPQGHVAAVFLTHFHSDHIDGLGELMLQRWVNGAHDSPMPVYGPSGVEAVVEGFNRAYDQDSIYRVAHLPPPPTAKRSSSSRSTAFGSRRSEPTTDPSSPPSATASTTPGGRCW
jgi:ribonuclease Z